MANLSNINGKFVVEQTTGFVGVGTTDPNYPIEVLNASAEIALNASGGSIYRLKSDSTDAFRINKNGVGDRLVIDGGGNATFSGNVAMGNGSDTINSDAVLTLRTTGFAGLDFKSARGAGNNIGGSRFYDSNSDTVAVAQLLVETDGSYNFYNGTNGAQNRVKIDSSGNFGIGTTSPSSYDNEANDLVVFNTTTPGITIATSTTTSRGSLLFADGTTNDQKYRGGVIYDHGTGMGGVADTMYIRTAINNYMVLGPTGNVGIGTKTPDSVLHLKKASGDANLHIQAVAAGDPNIKFTSANNRTGDLYYTDATTLARFSYDHADIAFKMYAHNNSSVDFYVSETKAYFPQNVGIGETSPDQKLNVREDGTGDTFRGIEVHNNSIDNARAGICFKAYDWVQSAIWHGRGTSAAYNGALVLGTNPNTSDLTVSGVTGRMWILNNGNVGIGNSPASDAKLEVWNGNLRVRGDQNNYIQLSNVAGNTKASLGNAGNEGDLSLYTSGNVKTVYLSSYYNSYINSSGGNLGIGATSPIGKLDILGVAGSVGSLGQLNRAGINLRIPNVLNQYTQIAFSNDGGGAFGYGAIGMVMTSTSGVGLGDMIFSTKGLGTDVVSTQRARITSGGNFIIGTETSTGCTLKVSSTKNGSESSPHFCLTGNGYSALHWLDTVAYYIFSNSTGRQIRIAANTGGVKLTVNATAWVSNSDIALKENLKPLENVLDKVKDYRCVEYNLKESPEDKKIGFIAQDWENDFPAIVDKDENDMLGIKYTETIPVLLKAIQELKSEIEILKNKPCNCNCK